MPTARSVHSVAAIPCRRQRDTQANSTVPFWKVTDWDTAECVLGYLTFRLFSHDGRYLFFASNRTGAHQIYRLDLERETAVPVTGPEGVNPDPGIPVAGAWRDVNMHPFRSEFATCTQGRLFMTDVETLEYRVLAECPPHWRRFDATPQFSGDGRWFATVFEQPDGRRGIAIGEVSERPAALEPVFLGEPGMNLGYLIAAPVRNRFILSVCYGDRDRQNDPTASREERARAWRLDTATREFRPYLVAPVGYRATHQFFGPEGRLYFHRKTVGTWTPAAVASIDLEGGDWRDHLVSADRKLGHGCIAPDGSWLVSDVQEPARNELIRVDLRTGNRDILGWPNASNNGPQSTHVHPSSDAQGRRVAFQSDRDGNCAIYLAEL